MKVMWLGEPYGPDVIEAFGFKFEYKGEFVDVPDDHPRANTIRTNRYFKVLGDTEGVSKPVSDTDSDRIEADLLREALDGAGVKYAFDATLADLRVLHDADAKA